MPVLQKTVNDFCYRVKAVVILNLIGTDNMIKYLGTIQKLFVTSVYKNIFSSR